MFSSDTSCSVVVEFDDVQARPPIDFPDDASMYVVGQRILISYDFYCCVVSGSRTVTLSQPLHPVLRVFKTPDEQPVRSSSKGPPGEQ
jgi:hypothetical protein